MGDLQEQSRVSKTIVYGVHWDGRCLANAPLSNLMLEEMRSNSGKSKDIRRKGMEAHYTAAASGFELLMQVIGKQYLARQYISMAIEAWATYISYTEQFRCIKNPLFDTGLHIALFGWFTKSGKIHIEPAYTHQPELLDHKQLIQLARGNMQKIEENQPSALPANYCFGRVGAW